MNMKTATLIIKHGKNLFWQFFTSEDLARDFVTVYSCDNENFKYRLWCENGDVEFGIPNPQGWSISRSPYKPARIFHY